MNDSLEQLLKILKPVWLRKWVVLLVAALVCATGWPYVYYKPDQYKAMARVFINSQSMLTPLLKGLAVDSNAKERLADITRRTLLSRPNLETVVRQTDLDLLIETPQEKEMLLTALNERISVSGGDQQDIYIIEYKNEDAKLAKDVVETLLAIFVENTLGVARRDTTVTERFLDEQIEVYEKRLVAAEERLKEFKRANVGLMPTEAGGYFAKLDAATERLAQARLELSEAEQRRNQIRIQIAAELAANAEALQTSYDERLLLMEERLDELLLLYTEHHPDVIAVERAVEELTRLQQDEHERLSQEHVEDSNTINIVRGSIYGELKVTLGRVQADVSALRVRVEEYEKRVIELRRLVDTIPRVEAELAKLDRDYHINKENYETLVNRRESAKISREADQSVDDIQFKIIDPPVEPLVPIGPNRPVYLTLVLAAGLGLGGGVGWFLSLFRPTFINSRDLREYTDLPVLGSVSMVMNRGQLVRRNMENGFFVLFGLMLVVVYVALILMQKMNVGIF